MSKFYDKLSMAIGGDPKSKEAMLATKKPVVGKSTFAIPVKKAVFQADLIYMPKDKEYNYIFVLVDIGSKIMDAEPMKERTGLDAIEALFKIFKRKTYISQQDVSYLYSDPGSEFNNRDFAEWCLKSGIVHRMTRTARKNQMAIVESMNHTITKVLGQKMAEDKLRENSNQISWVDKLKPLVKAINENKNHDLKSIKSMIFNDPKIPEKEHIFKEGTLVHIPLEQPKDIVSGERLHGKFRHGDQRYESTPREIEAMMMYPNQPIRYLIKGVKNASYLGSELLPVSAYKK